MSQESDYLKIQEALRAVFPQAAIELNFRSSQDYPAFIVSPVSVELLPADKWRFEVVAITNDRSHYFDFLRNVRGALGNFQLLTMTSETSILEDASPEMLLTIELVT